MRRALRKAVVVGSAVAAGSFIAGPVGALAVGGAMLTGYGLCKTGLARRFMAGCNASQDKSRPFVGFKRNVTAQVFGSKADMEAAREASAGAGNNGFVSSADRAPV